MAKNKTAADLTFDDHLILFHFFLNEFGLESLESLGNKLNSIEYEGMNESGNTRFFTYLSIICKTNGARISEDKLRLYDENICRYTRQIGEKRGGINLKYFQYISLLFTEMYLDRYFGDADKFCSELNEYLNNKIASTANALPFEPYTVDKMNKLAFMCATGSGKTLIMHINILQFLYYFKRAKRINNRLSLNKVIVLAPNEGMSNQHLDELMLSSISAAMFEKDRGFVTQKEDVIVIDINKLKEEGKVKTVSVDSFEHNNLVLVDEGHRGLSGNIWYDYRNRLSCEGFAFEYSATFKQALNANAKKAEEKALMEEYGKSIIIDYSYKYFYSDGYGKDYRIYNLKSSIDEEQRHLYMTGCLLSFYQQMKLYDTEPEKLREFNIEKPLLVFVGNRVTASTSKEELTDIEEVLAFIDKFVRNKALSISRIKAILTDDTKLTDGSGNELFSQHFGALNRIFCAAPDPSAVFDDILKLVFNSDTDADEPRLHLDNIKQVSGEIGMKIGKYGDYFGVISIGDTATLIKNCEIKGITSKSERFVSESLFRAINQKDSKIKVLIGSRKFTEGWNSWRVSTMGLINFAKSEGSQAIQLFGRGVRLKGYNRRLKRSRCLGDRRVKAPCNIEVLETLTVFGVKAQYMEDFKKFLEIEGVATNDNFIEFKLPVISRYPDVKDKKLHVIRVKEGANFKKQAPRLILTAPDEGFLRYLLRSKTVIDCRSKIQTIESTSSRGKLEVLQEEHILPSDKLQYLDYFRIFEELELYKNEKSYYNISIVKDKLIEILKTDGWYSLLIPKNHLQIDSIAKLESATDYAIMVLKSYMEKFYKYEKDRWEAPLLEYALLEEDNNFVDEYSITYASSGDIDPNRDELDKFLSDTDKILKEYSGLDEYQKSFKNRFIMFDFKSHLYAPLVCLKKSNLNIQVSPIALNEDEMKFVSLLKEYMDTHTDELAEKSLYLLRNKSKAGMGFFEAGNFYPDYILWIDEGEKEYITFIDPKGLMNIRPDDPKIQFYKTVKDLQVRLAPTAKDKTIILNSFIMSVTPSYQLKQWWSCEYSDLEACNVYTSDDSKCIESMIEKILKE